MSIVHGGLLLILVVVLRRHLLFDFGVADQLPLPLTDVDITRPSVHVVQWLSLYFAVLAKDLLVLLMALVVAASVFIQHVSSGSKFVVTKFLEFVLLFVVLLLKINRFPSRRHGGLPAAS
jgi:hypothetical protein